MANPIDLWPAVEQHGTRKAFVTALEAVRDDPNADAVSLSTYYAGTVEDWGIEEVTQDLRAEGKIVFSWIIGMMDATRKAQMRLQSHGVPVYRELSRAVESVSAVF